MVRLQQLQNLMRLYVKIIDKNNKSNEIIKSNIDKLLNKRNEEFAAEQNKYIQSLQDTQTEIGECENKLTAKYAEFISTLENMNITNLYEQNIQLKNEFNKRTTLLMVISVVSIDCWYYWNYLIKEFWYSDGVYKMYDTDLFSYVRKIYSW